MTLNSKSFGLTGGILWGLCMLVMTLLAVGTGYATEFLNVVVSIYPGYTITPLGSVVGLVYGFIDMGVGLFIFAELYNFLERKLESQI